MPLATALISQRRRYFLASIFSHFVAILPMI